jgi:hypothetical protein
VHYTQDIARVMQSVWSHDGLAYSDTGSHTSWAMDDGHMSFHIADMVILMVRWAGSPHFWTVHPRDL